MHRAAKRLVRMLQTQGASHAPFLFVCSSASTEAEHFLKLYLMLNCTGKRKHECYRIHTYTYKEQSELHCNI